MKKYLLVIVPVAISLVFFAGSLFLTEWGSCNVKILSLEGTLLTTGPSNHDPLEGEIFTSADDFLYALGEVEEDASVEGIIVSINSNGGSVVAAKEIADALRGSSKVVVALAREAANSAAYWVAAGTEAIVASENSDVGSIGVIITIPDESDRNKQEGVKYEIVSSGKFKDLGSGNKPLTTDERALLRRDVDILHQNFVSAVAELRDLPIEEVAALADGSSMLGRMAHEKGLVDIVGGFNEAVEYIEERIGGEVDACYY